MLDAKTREREILEIRVRTINSVYSAFSALSESGVTVQDENTSEQVLCPYHDDKNKPSARYYSPSGRVQGHFYCFKCKLRLDAVGIFARYKHCKFMDALKMLERRYNITPPKIEDSLEISFNDRSGGYESEAWKDVDRMLGLCEEKLMRIKPKCSYPEFCKICRLLDNVKYDWDKLGKANDDMIIGLNKARMLMDEISSREDPIDGRSIYLLS